MEILTGALIAGVINSVVIGFAVKFIDKKLKVAEDKAKRRAEFASKKTKNSELMQAKQNKILHLLCAYTTDQKSIDESIKNAQRELHEIETELSKINMDIIADAERV